MRTLRVVHYAVYVVALLLLQGTLAVVMTRSVDAEPSALTLVVNAAAIMTLPFVILQVIAAALVLKALPLRRLFLLTAAFAVGGSLLSWALVHVPEEFHLWLNWLPIGSFLGGSLCQLMLPVLILWFLQRRRASRANSQANATLDGASEVPEVAPMDKGRIVKAQESAHLWYRWDIALAVVPLSCSLIFDPTGMINYLSGLINTKVLAVAVFSFVALMPVALLCLVALLVRMLVVWPRRISRWPRLLLCWGAVVGVFVACFVLPFMGLRMSPCAMYTRGFRRNMQARVNVPAIQQWLSTIDPNRLNGQDVDATLAKELLSHPLVVGLFANGGGVSLDSAGRPMLELEWGSGVLGTWGLTIGHQDMAIPRTQPRTKEILSNGQVFYNDGQYRLPLAPGAYVWHDFR